MRVEWVAVRDVLTMIAAWVGAICGPLAIWLSVRRYKLEAGTLQPTISWNHETRDEERMLPADWFEPSLQFLVTNAGQRPISVQSVGGRDGRGEWFEFETFTSDRPPHRLDGHQSEIVRIWNGLDILAAGVRTLAVRDTHGREYVVPPETVQPAVQKAREIQRG